VASSDVHRKLIAILSADVVGYSRLMAADETSTVATLEALRETIEALAPRHGGRVVNFVGDNFLAEFQTATDATSCAVALQREIQQRNTGAADDRKMQFRMGIHVGEVRVEGERIFGTGVNIAARLEGLAEPGGVCVSSTVREQIGDADGLVCEDLGLQRVKNLPSPVHAYRRNVSSSTSMTVAPGTACPFPHGRACLQAVQMDGASHATAAVDRRGLSGLTCGT
jgi:adenylate cyclase